MRAIVYAPGAATFLLNWPTTDVNITTLSGASFLTSVRSTIKDLSGRILDIQHHFLLQQWRSIESMVVERGP
jgi:hypothetical protein